MSKFIAAQDWVERELEGFDCGDSRLNERGKLILKSLADNPQASIPAACGNWSDTLAAYRFFENDHVTHEQIISAHSAATLERMDGEKVLLAIQDTSSLNYTGLEKTEGLGEIGDSTNVNARGLILHTTYVVTGEGVPLGILDQNIWARKRSAYKKSQDRMSTPVENKESSKWLQAMQRVSAQTLSLTGAKLYHVMDREADIYDLFNEAENLEELFIIRAKHNRKINKSSRCSNDGVQLRKHLLKQKPLATVKMQIDLHAAANKTREAEVEIRVLKFRLTAPRAKSMKVHKFWDEWLNLTVISAKEVSRKDEFEPIDWLLVTNDQIKTCEQALECLQYYCRRWQIEVFHRILKTGCRVEKIRLSQAKGIKAFAALVSVVAWRLHWMTMFSRHTPRASPDLVFTKKEQHILSILSNRKITKNLRIIDYTIMLARLGGFLNRKNDGFPGSEVLWRGHIKLKDFMLNLAKLETSSGRTYV